MTCLVLVQIFLPKEKMHLKYTSSASIINQSSNKCRLKVWWWHPRLPNDKSRQPHTHDSISYEINKVYCEIFRLNQVMKRWDKKKIDWKFFFWYTVDIFFIFFHTWLYFLVSWNILQAKVKNEEYLFYYKKRLACNKEKIFFFIISKLLISGIQG